MEVKKESLESLLREVEHLRYLLSDFTCFLYELNECNLAVSSEVHRNVIRRIHDELFKIIFRMKK